MSTSTVAPGGVPATISSAMARSVGSCAKRPASKRAVWKATTAAIRPAAFIWRSVSNSRKPASLERPSFIGACHIGEARNARRAAAPPSDAR